MKKKCLFSLVVNFLLSSLCNCYLPVLKLYDDSQSMIPHMRYLRNDSRMLAIPGFVNFLIYDSQGFTVTSQRHLNPVMIHPFPGLITMDVIPGTLEAYISTSESKIYRVRYLTGLRVSETATRGIALKIQAFIDGSVAYMSKEWIIYMKADYQIIVENSSYANQMRDFVGYPEENSLYLLLKDRLIKFEIAPLVNISEIQTTLINDAIKLENDPASISFFIEGMNNSNLTILQFNRNLSEYKALWVDTLGNPTYRECAYTRTLLICNKGAPLNNSKYGGFMTVFRKFPYFFNLGDLPCKKRADLDIIGCSEARLLQKNYYDDNLLHINSNEITQVETSTKTILYYYGILKYDPIDFIIGFEQLRIHVLLFSNSIALVNHDEIKIPFEETTSLIDTVVPIPDKLRFIVITKNESYIVNISNKNYTKDKIPSNFSEYCSDFLVLYKKKQILFIGNRTTYFFLNWETNQISYKQCFPYCGDNILLVSGDSEFIAYTKDKEIYLYFIDGRLRTSYKILYKSSIIKIRAPGFIDTSTNQFAVLFSDNSIRFYATRTGNYLKKYKFEENVSDFDFIPNQTKMVVVFLNADKSDVKIFDFVKDLLEETVLGYPFKIDKLVRTRNQLFAKGRGMILHKLRFDTKCPQSFTVDEINGVCIRQCPVDRPLRVISKDSCVNTCPQGTKNTDIPADLVSIYGKDICYDYLEPDVQNCEQTIPNCEICFAGECLKCKENFYRKTVNSEYDTCVETSTCMGLYGSQTNGYGTCKHFPSGLDHCLEKDSTTYDCVKCVKNKYPTHDQSLTNNTFSRCSECILGLTVKTNYTKKFPSITSTGDGTEQCIRSNAVNNDPCSFYFTDCWYPAPNKYLNDIDGDGNLETADSCDQEGNIKSFDYCEKVSNLVPGCKSYSEEKLCQNCKENLNSVQMRNDGKTDMCAACSGTKCECGPLCSSCQ